MMYSKRTICTLVGTGILGLAATVSTPGHAGAADLNLQQSGDQRSVPQVSVTSVSRDLNFGKARPSEESAFRLAQATAPAASQQDHSAHLASPQVPAAHAADDVSMRNMYIAMGAMTGFMFAAMPVTTTAVSAAVGAGIATMWLYDAYVTPQPNM